MDPEADAQPPVPSRASPVHRGSVTPAAGTGPASGALPAELRRERGQGVVAVVDQDRRSTVTDPEVAVLEQVLGPAVGDLPPAVRRFHASTSDVVGTGTFVIQPAGSRAGRFLARALRMPRSVGETPVALSIRRERGGAERWCRV